MNFNEMLEQLIKLHEDFLLTLKEMQGCEDEEHSYGKDMGIPPLVDLMSPKNVGKMIPQIGDDKYGSLGKMNLTINLSMGDK
jgi:hypothetical protein